MMEFPRSATSKRRDREDHKKLAFTIVDAFYNHALWMDVISDVEEKY